MLEDLRALIPVPESPIDVDAAQVRLNESALGIRFPSDYVAYGHVYGTGKLHPPFHDHMCALIWVIVSPGCSRYCDYVKWFSWRLNEERKSYESFGLSLGIFPEEGGLLPFAHHDDIYFTWRTVGNPNDWTVVPIWAYDEGGYVTTGLGFSDFLLRFLTRKLVIPELGYSGTWAADRFEFEPEALIL